MCTSVMSMERTSVSFIEAFWSLSGLFCPSSVRAKMDTGEPVRDRGREIEIEDMGDPAFERGRTIDLLL